MPEYEIIQDYNSLVNQASIMQSALSKEQLDKAHRVAKAKLEELYKDKVKALKKSKK